MGLNPDEHLLEARLRRIEEWLNLPPLSIEDANAWLGDRAPPATPAIPVLPERDVLEARIGEYWLARVGVLALVMGTAFLVTYPFLTMPAWVPVLIGFVAAGAFHLLSRYSAASLPETARIFRYGAVFLLYFATMRLHFFAAHPVISSPAIGLGFLTLVIALQFWFAARERNELTACLVVLLAAITGGISNQAMFAFSLQSGVALLAVELVRRHGWQRVYFVSLGTALVFHVQWLLNNPLGGNPVRAAAEPAGNLVFLAIYATAYYAASLLPGQAKVELSVRISRALVISAGVMVIVAGNILVFPSVDRILACAGMAGAFLGGAIILWQHRQSRYATAIHACAGYLSLSAAIILYFAGAQSYLALAWQSLLVAVTAIWFRSKIVIVANLFIFSGIYLAYLLAAPAAGAVNLSFAVVALLTARLLNWQRERLELRSEWMRNIYLGAATIIVPYGLQHTVPGAWVSTSWLFAAGVYFGASLLLRNLKYRWMAIVTIFAAIGHVFIVDMARLAPAYRIASFLILGVVLLSVSMVYARSRRSRGH